MGTSSIQGNDKITPMTGRNGKENDGAVTHQERMKARTPDIPVDLVQRSVKTEVPAKQELHRLTEAQRTRLMVKQDEIPRIEKPGMNCGYYLFMEDDTGCMIQHRDEEGNIQLIRDMDMDQILPMDQITETEAETYQIPEED